LNALQACDAQAFPVAEVERVQAHDQVQQRALIWMLQELHNLEAFAGPYPGTVIVVDLRTPVGTGLDSLDGERVFKAARTFVKDRPDEIVEYLDSGLWFPKPYAAPQVEIILRECAADNDRCVIAAVNNKPPRRGTPIPQGFSHSLLSAAFRRLMDFRVLLAKNRAAPKPQAQRLTIAEMEKLRCDPNLCGNCYAVCDGEFKCAACRQVPTAP
jgi:hypothetical protein